MNDLALVQIVDCFENLSDGLRSVFLRELALVTNSIKKFSAGSQLGNDVVLVLQNVRKWNPCARTNEPPTLDSNQS